jgi:GNAT superfamily N-acetyltransferase
MVRDGIRACNGLGAGSDLGVDEEKAFSLIYSAPRTTYLVADRRDTVVAGAGIGPLPCDFVHIAELQRFVLLPMSGHLEIGRQLLDQCLDAADRFGFRVCYVELDFEQVTMRKLLERARFRPTRRLLREPTDSTANSCYYKNLASHQRRPAGGVARGISGRLLASNPR